jgi:hypothetical protein
MLPRAHVRWEIGQSGLLPIDVGSDSFETVLGRRRPMVSGPSTELIGAMWEITGIIHSLWHLDMDCVEHGGY